MKLNSLWLFELTEVDTTLGQVLTTRYLEIQVAICMNGVAPRGSIPLARRYRYIHVLRIIVGNPFSNGRRASTLKVTVTVERGLDRGVDWSEHLRRFRRLSRPASSADLEEMVTIVAKGKSIDRQVRRREEVKALKTIDLDHRWEVNGCQDAYVTMDHETFQALQRLSLYTHNKMQDGVKEHSGSLQKQMRETALPGVISRSR